MPNIESLRKEAKALLRKCRDRQPAALARVRSQLPRAMLLKDEDLSSQIKLADVHHALAREHGCANWAELKQSREPLEQFLAAIREGASKAAKKIQSEHPDLAEDSIHAACAIGDADAVRYHIGIDPKRALEPLLDWPPILYACASPLHKLSSRHAAGILQSVALLLDHGADPNSYTVSGKPNPGRTLSALFRATISEHTTLTLLLARRGAHFSGVTEALAPTEPGMESMREAFRKHFGTSESRDRMTKRIAELRELRPQLEQSPPFSLKEITESVQPDSALFKAFWEDFNPNRTSGNDGEAPLHRLATKPHREAQTIGFLDHGADPNLARHDGKTPYVLAIRAGNTQAAEVMLAKGARREHIQPIDALIGACIRASESEVRAILAEHPSLFTTMGSEDRESIIQIAGTRNHRATRLVAEFGFDSNSVGESGATALHVAAWHGDVEMVHILLERGATVTLLDATYGGTPLAWAAHGSRNCRNADEDYCAVVRLLLAAGAEPRDAAGRWDVAVDTIASSKVADLLKTGGV